MQGENIISNHVKDCITAHLQGNSSAEQTEAFRKWLNASKTNRYFFNQLELIWQAAAEATSQQFDADKAWKEVEAQIAHTSQQAERSKYVYHPYRRLYRKLKIAAILVFAYVLGIATVRLAEKPAPYGAQYVEMTAPKGSRAFVTLDDGTKVWLNAGTSLKYPKDYGQRQRNVSLTGEAYFEVAKNKDKPFIVNANGVNITALGTAFNVKAYLEDGQVETTLTEGSVSIVPVDNQTNIRPIVLQPNQKAVLKAGVTAQEIPAKQTTTVQPASTESNPAAESQKSVPDITELADTRPYTSWKDPRWVFKQQDLAELATKLERRYDVNIVFIDEHLKNYVVSGTLLDETLEQVMNTLRLTAPIDYIIDHKTVVLKENPESKKQYQQLIR